MNFTRLTQGIFLAAACFSLAACMTPQQRYAQDYTVAKRNFDQQNYRTAFSRIQVPAKAGNPNAQYALGYMYYYGKGTVENPVMARYWFKQASKQGQPDAQRALQTMQSTNQSTN